MWGGDPWGFYHRSPKGAEEKNHSSVTGSLLCHDHFEISEGDVKDMFRSYDEL